MSGSQRSTGVSPFFFFYGTLPRNDKSLAKNALAANEEFVNLI